MSPASIGCHPVAKVLDFQSSKHASGCSLCFFPSERLLKCADANCTLYFCERCDKLQSHLTHDLDLDSQDLPELRKRVNLEQQPRRVGVYIGLTNGIEARDVLKAIEGIASAVSNQYGLRWQINFCFSSTDVKNAPPCAFYIALCHSLEGGNLSLPGEEMSIPELIEVFADLELKPQVFQSNRLACDTPTHTTTPYN